MAKPAKSAITHSIRQSAETTPASTPPLRTVRNITDGPHGDSLFPIVGIGASAGGKTP